ncbi:hypothetical protein PSACC_02590 [Paramicrosporidium saccamoebae]|uniref:Uncharacterized protein n=1 Tax=Paramicrosporidium saccamoebae TaxID=1246581 RepID=A0A2H9TIK2_9FUNG|nr:hypothetical protein PSACC_02590 [Paramicrosporidium saccamoebae]
MTSITSEEVNYLVVRYLQEAGFVHSAFSFSQESFINKSEIRAGAVAPGMLVTLLQRGLHYTSIEFHLNDDGSERECSRAYSLLEPHVCERGVQMVPRPPTPTIPKESKRRKKENGENGKKRASKEMEDGSTASEKTNVSADPKPPKPVKTAKKEKTTNSLEVSILTGHESEVITCAWNPSRDISLLASASGDGTVRLWTVPSEGPWNLEDAKMSVRILEHAASGDSRDVTTMDWSPDGMTLATGCYDGKARLWNSDGELLSVLNKHNGPIFQLQWSPDGAYLVSVGVEPAVAIWDVASRTLLRSYDHHTAPALDVDWRDDRTFATCSTDKLILIYSLDQPDEPVLTLTGHSDEVNSIKWSPKGDLLVSSSDDMTARVWRVQGVETYALVHTFSEHLMEIYTAKWSTNPETPLIATASFDGTVKLWDPVQGLCRHTLQQHTQPVYAISFSPCGRYLASGSLDAALYLWSVADGRLLQNYHGRGGIFEVTWSPTGHRIAACTSDATCCVFEAKM